MTSKVYLESDIRAEDASNNKLGQLAQATGRLTEEV